MTPDLLPKGMISLEEFAIKKNIEPQKVIKMIRDGFYVGRKINEQWYVSESELLAYDVRGQQPRKSSSDYNAGRITLIVIVSGLIIVGLAALLDGEPEGFALFSLPGVMIGTYLFMTKPKKKTEINIVNQADELIKWSQLRDSGVITEAEFKEKKKEIM